MTDNNDFLQALSKIISDKTKEGRQISTEEAYSLIEETILSFTDVQAIKERISIPILVSIEEDFFTAYCPTFNRLKGKGKTVPNAIEDLKKEIERWNQICMKTERRMKFEEIFKNFQKDYH